jgi:hypothetical protein
MYECYNSKLFRNDIEPQDKHGYSTVNPQVLYGKTSEDFQRVECSGEKCSGEKSCPHTQYASKGPHTQYASKDPRLISVAHGGQVLTLDRPPMDSTLQLKDVSQDKRLNHYGKYYRTYSDIDGGQYLYYINHAQEDPFFSPNFTISSRVEGGLYRDPMGSFKPDYQRKPLKCNDPLNTEKDSYEGGLSWIHDSLEHREDIMSRQLAVHNQQRWQPRWEGLTNLPKQGLTNLPKHK